MPDPTAPIRALRNSHDRFVSIMGALDDQAVQGPSYDTDWTIADVASHLGSQAEIFALFLDAGLSHQNTPGSEQFGPIWDRWNSLPPRTQVTDSLTANEDFVTRVEGLAEPERSAFQLSIFGSDLDLSGLVTMRLGEHAVHTWDIAVALDSGAQIVASAVELLIDTLPATAARAGKSTADARTVTIETSAPRRRFALTTGPDVTLAGDSGTGPADLELPAEALVRLVYGRLDPEHTPATLAGAEMLVLLRQVFPGF
jgi:uncharacterized protein (TIGR03083 family)